MIINSLLDTDFYKFSMGQVVLHQFPWVDVKYKFKCRNDIKWTEDHLSRLTDEVRQFCTHRFTEGEIEYLSGIRFLKKSYIDFLRLYQPNPKHFNAWIEDGELKITVEGPWFLTIYWEVPLLAIVSEIYCKREGVNYANCEEGWRKLKEKCEIAKGSGLRFVDFGTRRRASRSWHNNLVAFLKNSGVNFVGTSNVMLAKKHGLAPIGTMAHEFLQAGQAIGAFVGDSQKVMLQAWADEYRGDLGIALTDVIGIDAFLKDFDLYFAKLYDGLRHDSGDPYWWADKVIAHYESLGIDPKTKSLVFSDGLDFNKCAELHETYKNITNVSFGIGTNLTNDFDDVVAPKIVIKMIECGGQPVAKISDSPGKGMCEDQVYVDHLKKVFGVEK